jgi:hypothetical protein
VTDTRPPEEPLESAGAPPAQTVGPPEPAKPKLSVSFLILGFLLPVALYAGVVALLSSVDTNGVSFTVGFGVHFIASLLMFAIGAAKARPRLKSFGLGGMLFYAVVALLGLLLFGSCLIGLWN